MEAARSDKVFACTFGGGLDARWVGANFNGLGLAWPVCGTYLTTLWQRRMNAAKVRMVELAS